MNITTTTTRKLAEILRDKFEEEGIDINKLSDKQLEVIVKGIIDNCISSRKPVSYDDDDGEDIEES